MLAAAGVTLDGTTRLTANIVRIACGAMVWSLLLVLLAVLGAFHPWMIGVAGWLMFAAWAIGNRRPRAAAVPFAPAGASRLATAAVVALLALASVLALGWPKESLIAERDEAIYTLHAMHLLRSGQDRIDIAAAGLSESATAAMMASEKRLELPGIYPTDDAWTFQFSVLPSAWIAQMAATFGDAGLFRFNAVLGLLSALAFLALLREWLGPAASAWAVATTAVFVLNPAQVWVSRVNLSEPLAQWFVLSGLLMALLALRQRHVRLAWLAGAVIGASVLVRVDALLTALLVVAACPFAWAVRASGAPATRTWLALVVGAAVATAASLAYYITQVEPYWTDHARYTAPLLVALVPLALACGLLAMDKRPESLAPWVRTGLAIACAGLLAAFAYAALLRPNVEPHSLLNSPLVPQLQGTRDYREISLHNLAAYLGWPLLLLALAGYIGAMWRLRRDGTDPATPLLLTVFLGASVAFLWNPMISPDHVWASRRFVPIVIPATLAFSAWMLVRATRSLAPRRAALLATLLSVALCSQLLWAQRHTLWVAEDKGLLASLRQLDGRLPEGQRLFVSGSTLSATLLAGFGKPALPLLDGTLAQSAATRDDVARACTSQRPCSWLRPPGGTYPGLQLSLRGLHELPRQRIARTPVALARQVERSQWPVADFELQGLQPPAEDRLVGDHRDWRLAEAGFWQDETGPWGSVRWTDGDARLQVPALPSRAIVVTLQLPADVTTALRLDVNGRMVFEGVLESGRRRIEFAPPPADAQGYWTFGIRSDRFIPSDRYGGEDRRTLGVILESIRLLPLAPAPAWSQGAALRASLVLAAGDAAAPRTHLLGVRNSGDWSWPAAVDAAPGEAPVQIGLLWLARGDPPGGLRRLEQRLALPQRLEPGEDVLLPLVLKARGPDGAKLPVADYDVIVSPVLEGVAWFHDHGAEPLRIPVEAGELR